ISLPEPGRNEAARLHHANRHFGRGMAAHHACTAARANASHRRTTSCLYKRFRISDPRECIRRRIAAIGLDRWPYDIRWAGGGADTNRRYAEELIALAPDVIMAAGNAAAGPMLQATRTIPIVFTIVPDPVGAGLVDSLGRPS